MNILRWIDNLPLAVLFGLTFVFIFLAIAGGMYLGATTRKWQGNGIEMMVAVVGATLGLLAFLLAFTFNMAASWYDARKQLYLEEVNVIGTAYLRAGLLPQPSASEVRALLREYVDLRASLALDHSKLKEAIERSEIIQNQIWSDMEKMAINQPSILISHSLFIQSLNDVIDLQSKRVIVGAHFRIPETIWLGLYVVAALAMIMVGYQLGQLHQYQNLVNVLLALTFSTVILLIVDLDRAFEGTIQLNQQPIFELQQKLRASP